MEYLIILIAFVIAMFVWAKRPMYEIMLAAYVLLVIISGRITSIGTYFFSAMNTYLLFTICAFTVFSLIFDRSGIVNDMIRIITALVGRFSGGAGYVALISSSAMGALSGTGPGNAAAIGVICIPAMKKTGYSSELAAVVEAAASSLGPIIPPSGAVVILYSILEGLYPGQYTFSHFYLLAFVLSFWCLVQRFITLYIRIKQCKLAPIPKEDRLSVRQALKEGWKTLLLPVILFAPFIFDAVCKDFITARIGSASGTFSNFLLTVMPSIAILFVIVLVKQNGKKLNASFFINTFKENINSVVPVIIMALASYAISNLFSDIGVTEDIAQRLSGIDIPLWAVAFIVPLIFAVLGMFLDGLPIIMLLGSVTITIAASVGIDPVLAAIMVNVMTYGFGHLSPPFALCLLVCIGIAKSDFKKTSIEAVFWMITQYILIVLIFLGLIPMFGLA